MVCNFTEETLFILNILYKNRCLSSDKGYHSKKLKKIYIKKFSDKNHLSLKGALKDLKNAGYITVIKKDDDKYYISNIKETILILHSFGYIPSDSF